MTIPIDFMNEGEDFKRWKDENNVTMDEMVDGICNILRCYHAIRFPQMKEEIEQLRKIRKDKTIEGQKEVTDAKEKKDAERALRAEQEKKVVEDIQKPIPLDSSAEEATAIRFGEKNETKSDK